MSCQLHGHHPCKALVAGRPLAVIVVKIIVVRRPLAVTVRGDVADVPEPATHMRSIIKYSSILRVECAFGTNSSVLHFVPRESNTTYFSSPSGLKPIAPTGTGLAAQ